VQLLDLAALWLRQDALIMSLPLPGVQWHLIDEEDWASSWKNTGNPRKLALLINPAWIPIPEKSDRHLRFDRALLLALATTLLLSCA